MVRRTLALVGAAALTVGVTGLAGPAAADSGAGVQQAGVVLHEIAADLDTTVSEGELAGDFVEIINDSTIDVNVGGWKIVGCNPAGDFPVATIPVGTTIPAGDKFLFADAAYDASDGTDRDRPFGSGANLVQSDGGVALLDSNSMLMDDVKYGSPSQQLDCATFTPTGVNPADNQSINRDLTTGWPDGFNASPTPENSLN